MSLREDHALKAWCPFSRMLWAKLKDGGGWHSVNNEHGAFNRVRIPSVGEEHSVGCCIGAACMAWRSTGLHKVGEEVELVGLTKKRKRTDVVRVGHCGLAGSPGLTDAELQAAPVTADGSAS